MTRPAAPAPARRAAGRAASDLRGAGRLAVDAVLGLTDLVENLHHNILRVPAPLGAVSEQPTSGLTGLVYRSIRGVTRLAGGTLDALLGQLQRLLDTPEALPSSAQREALVAALNGVLGDHLAASGNPLATPMTLRHEGRALPLAPAALAAALPQARPRVLLLLHGLCMHPGQWQRNGFDLGKTLAAQADATLLHLHYNSGLHVSENGRALADRLHALQQAWPLPLQDIVVVAHSMGGLLVRSALHQATARGDDWPRRVRGIAFLGTPHHGAPLERGGHWIDRLLGASPYTAAFARLGRLRSAGITDLRHGSLLEADWAGTDRFAHGRDTRAVVPLPAGVDCLALAGALTRPDAALSSKLVGDGLVPVDSALGRHAQRLRCLDFEPDRQCVLSGVGHLELMGHAEVQACLQRWLTALTAPAAPAAPAAQAPA
ncbi:MAG: alpha/beta fold hydrolase [Rubrivivax sp.]|nr:alpha/beta fold hydrolase [Rubrivivax sp.]